MHSAKNCSATSPLPRFYQRRSLSLQDCAISVVVEPFRLLLLSMVESLGRMFRDMVRDELQPAPDGPAFVWKLLTKERLTAGQGWAVDFALLSQVSEWAHKTQTLNSRSKLAHCTGCAMFVCAKPMLRRMLDSSFESLRWRTKTRRFPRRQLIC